MSRSTSAQVSFFFRMEDGVEEYHFTCCEVGCDDVTGRFQRDGRCFEALDERVRSVYGELKDREFYYLVEGIFIFIS